jgi:hypothetical protein
MNYIEVMQAAFKDELTKIAAAKEAAEKTAAANKGNKK